MVRDVGSFSALTFDFSVFEGFLHPCYLHLIEVSKRKEGLHRTLRLNIQTRSSQILRIDL